MLKLRRFHREPRRLDHRARFEHEGHRIGDVLGLGGVGGAGLLEGFSIRTVPAHAVVQAAPSRHEAFLLGVVDAVDQPHELAGEVAVEPGRAEGVLHGQPARREDHEVDVCPRRECR